MQQIIAAGGSLAVRIIVRRARALPVGSYRGRKAMRPPPPPDTFCIYAFENTTKKKDGQHFPERDREFLLWSL